MPTRKAHKMTMEVRRKRVAEHLLAGWTYRQIAAEEQISLRTVFKDVQAILGRLEREQIALADEARRLDLARIDVAISSIFAAVKSGQLGGVDRLVKLLERRAKMLGYDAPDKLSLKRVDDVEELTDDELAAIAAGNQPRAGSR